LDLLDEASLRQLGWLPVRLEEGLADEKFVGSTFTVFENEVVETKQWRKYTDEERAEIESQTAKAVRTDRNKRLAESDWTQLIDAPVNVAQWSAYRQALRDVPEQAGFPFNVNWPVQPE
jgi:hypothetical protein